MIALETHIALHCSDSYGIATDSRVRVLLWLTVDLVGVDGPLDQLPAIVFRHVELDAKGIFPEQMCKVEHAPQIFHDPMRTLHGITRVSVDIESNDTNNDGNEAETGLEERNVIDDENSDEDWAPH